MKEKVEDIFRESMKIYRPKKEIQISSFLILILILTLEYFNPEGWNNHILEASVMLILLIGGIIGPYFVRVIITEDYIESCFIGGKKKLFWNEIVEVTNHPIFQVSLKLIPSKESNKKVMTIPFTYIEGNILKEINSRVSPDTKCTIYVEKE